MCGSTTCLTGQTCCGTSWVDRATDPNNRGKCGAVCAAGEGCVLGKCQAPVTCGG
jgi:stigma-specific protein Stig1